MKTDSLDTLKLAVGNALFGLDLWSSMADIEGLRETSEYKTAVSALEDLRLLLEGLN